MNHDHNLDIIMAGMYICNYLDKLPHDEAVSKISCGYSLVALSSLYHTARREGHHSVCLAVKEVIKTQLGR